MPYFRHMDKAECTSLYGEPETNEHLNGKKDLFEWIKIQDGVTNAVLEGWIPETKQRPDIMFEYNNQKCVIEYQCAPIATEYLERHELYQAAGIKDIWICGTEKYFGCNKKLNTLEKSVKIYYDYKNKMVYTLDNISENEFKEIEKIQTIRNNLNTFYKQKKYFDRTFHVMRNSFDYIGGYKNYLYIKDKSNSYYCSGYHYPSPTGRRSNKYPYPVSIHKYLENYSYATCHKLLNIKLTNISWR